MVIAPCEALMMLRDDIQPEQRSAHGIVNDGREIVIEQCPASLAIRTAGEKDFEAVVAVRASDAAAAGAKQRIQLRSPLCVRRSAQAEAMSEKPCPVIPRGVLRIICETFAPKVFFSFLAVGIVRIAEEPRRERLVVIRVGFVASGAFVLLRGGGREPLKRRHRELARIPRMIGGDLRITDGGMNPSLS